MLVIIDFSNLVWTSFYNSLRSSGISAENCPMGYDVHIDFFHQKLVKILQDQPCHEYMFALDRKPVRKFELYRDYKKSRNRIKFDPKPAVFKMLASWKSKVVYSEDNEADDAIASFVAKNLDQDIAIATTDKDLWQLCEIPNVKVYNFQKGIFVSKQNLYEMFSLEQYKHIKLHKTLWGDASDNVPNLAPRLQKSLLPIVKRTDGSLRSFWEEAQADKHSLNEKCWNVLNANKEKLKINYELVRLDFDCDVKLEEAKIMEEKKIDDHELNKLF